ncbi:integrase [Gossypium australe]|uniref:Integrase n=1 Tax=Gossypium australe TaxID=47621 RepID=A0A5B6WZR5_9ROSI|nr:integrase [Gossypium australe]
MQEGKVIAYASRQLKSHEKNYLTHDFELATILFALKIWRHHLYGEKRHIFTEHKTLKYIMTQKDLNLQQRRWLELLKDCELVIDYHPGKANVIVDALCRKSLFALRAMNTQLALSDDASESLASSTFGFASAWNDTRVEMDRVTMDFVSRLPLSLKKKDAIWVVVDRLTKSTHFIPVRIDFSLDKLSELYVSKIVRLRETELSEKQIHRVDLVRETEEKVKVIRDYLKAASNRHKSYTDLKRKDGDKVFLKVSPWKKILIFGRKGKLSPRFIRTYEIIERIGLVAYRLALPIELENIHNVFHVPMLHRYRSDPSHVISPSEIEIQLDMTYNKKTD